MIQIESSLLPYIQGQFPRIYQDNAQLFIAFVRSYMEWMSEPTNTYGKGRSLLTMRDIDTTLPEYLIHFQNKYLDGTPLTAVLDQPFLIKHARELIQTKGTPAGVKLFLQLLFNISSSVYIPGKDVLRASDGTWLQNPYLEISFKFNNAQLVGKQVRGSTSNATAFVNSFKTVMLPSSNRVRDVLVLENVMGIFEVSESVLNAEVNPDPVNAPIIMGSLGAISLESGGINFNVGDELILSSDKGQHGLAIVSGIVSRNGVVNFEIENGGEGYANSTTDPTNLTQTALQITQANSNPGIGATFQIGELSNTSILEFFNDFIYPMIEAPLNDPPTISNAGVGYANGDILVFARASNTDTPPLGSTSFGGVPIAANDAAGTITTDANGSITAINMTNDGEYVENPTVSVISTSGNGSMLVASVNTSSRMTINATAYGFAANPSGNGSSTIGSCLTSANITVGTIQGLYAINPGSGYNDDITIHVYSPVIAGLGIVDANGMFAGDDATILGQATQGEGAAVSTSVIDSGVGYVDGEYVNMTSPDNVGQSASGRVSLIGAGIDLGHWKDRAGWLNADKYLEDSYYYQTFSYEIQSDMPPEAYTDIVHKSWHLAGTQLFGRTVVEDDLAQSGSAVYFEVGS